jgi:hypothetical protein
MVRAILDGTKTQTRRLAKRIPWRAGANPNFSQARAFNNAGEFRIAGGQEMTFGFRCPYGTPGDQIWVKETWKPQVSHSCALNTCDCGDVDIAFAADGATTHHRDGTIPDEWTLPIAAQRGRNVSPLFLPRWASRILLEITGVRLERLQAISDADARSEGADGLAWDGKPGYADLIAWPLMEQANPYRNGFALLWESINGDGSWAENPWVWVVEFKRVNT